MLPSSGDQGQSSHKGIEEEVGTLEASDELTQDPSYDRLGHDRRGPQGGATARPAYLKLMLAQTSMSLSRKTLRSLDLISCPRSPYTVSVSVSHRSS